MAALQQGVVDAATGFVNNEPIQMDLAGTPTVVLALPADAQLPGNGLIVGQAALDGPKADAIRGFIAATRTGDGRDRRRPAEGPRRGDRAGAGAGAPTGLPSSP